MSAYADCRLCEHRCGVDRTRGPAGVCHASDRPRIFGALIEFGEEADLVPAYAISLSGCNFRCPFCITGEESQNAAAGAEVPLNALAAQVAGAAGRFRSVVVLGGEPTVYLPFLEDLCARLRVQGVPLALKTNLWLTPEALDRALAAFDTVIADFKFGNDACARALGAFPGYVEVLQRNLRAAAARRTTIVRHLLMPGHVECCFRPVAEFVRRELPGARLSLRDHFVPAFRAAGGLARVTSEQESAQAERILAEVA